MKHWTAEADALLREYMVEKGMTAKACAAALGGGLTRNAVLGRGDRLGLVTARSRALRQNPPASVISTSKRPSPSKSSVAAPVRFVVAWSKQEDGVLKRCADQGMTSSDAVEQLGGARTNDACAARARYLGLKWQRAHRRPSAAIKLRKAAEVSSRAEKREEKAPLAATPARPPIVRNIPLAGALWVPFAALEAAQCRYACDASNVEDFLFCGLPQEPGKPYCAHHCWIAYYTKIFSRSLRQAHVPPLEAVA